MGNIKLNILGKHNVYNALACLIVAIAFEIDFCMAKEAIENFAGVKRRCQKITDKDGVQIYHDYAHHPKQIEEMIAVGRQLCKNDKGRVVVVFEPHTYSRTKFLLKEFVGALALADKLFIAPVYSARESATAGYDSLKLANEIKKYNSTVEYLESYKEIVFGVKSFVKKGDIVLVLGAGTIFKLADMFLN
jgi:UDP-N-acetylmuramate--alanine ligase